jgi:hypothetical protein
VPVLPWAARAAPPADTTSTPATTQPSHPIRLPSPRILLHLVVVSPSGSGTSSPAQVEARDRRRFELGKAWRAMTDASTSVN